MRIPIIIGSSSIGKHGRTPAQWMLSKLHAISGISPEIIDLWEFPLQFYPASTMDISVSSDFNQGVVAKWHEKIESADVIIVMAPAGNPGYSIALQRALTELSPAWKDKPQCMISYGSETDPMLIDQVNLVAIHLKLSEQNTTSNELWNLMLNI